MLFSDFTHPPSLRHSPSRAFCHIFCVCEQKIRQNRLGRSQHGYNNSTPNGVHVTLHWLLISRGSRHGPVATITGTVLKGKSCHAAPPSWRRSPTGAPFKTILFSVFPGRQPRWHTAKKPDRFFDDGTLTRTQVHIICFSYDDFFGYKLLASAGNKRKRHL